MFEDSTGAPVVGTITYNDLAKTITFKPTAPLTSGKKYSAVLTPGIKAVNGQPLAGIKVTDFTVA